MRTIFFDDAILCALGKEPVPMFRHLKQALSGSVCKQVGLRWLEVVALVGSGSVL